jgi:hypothetical protein
VFALGSDEGLALVDQLRGVEGFLVDAGGQLHTSVVFRRLKSRVHRKPAMTEL